MQLPVKKSKDYYGTLLFVTAGTISAGSGNAILGFLVQAWNPADERIGNFMAGAGQRNLDCTSVNSVPPAVSVQLTSSLFTFYERD